jgi:quercetin dioxygenase-like cupin family protein
MQADSRTLAGFPMGSFTLRPFGGDDLMVVRVDGPAGSLAPAHAHPHEQMCVIVSGRVRFRIGDEETQAGPGDVLHIPSGVEHEAEVLEDTVFFDIFHPVREDFLAKLDEAR